MRVGRSELCYLTQNVLGANSPWHTAHRRGSREETWLKPAGWLCCHFRLVPSLRESVEARLPTDTVDVLPGKPLCSFPPSDTHHLQFLIPSLDKNLMGIQEIAHDCFRLCGTRQYKMKLKGFSTGLPRCATLGLWIILSWSNQDPMSSEKKVLPLP